MVDRIRARIGRSRIGRALLAQRPTERQRMAQLRQEFAAATRVLRAVSTKWGLRGTTMALDGEDLYFRDDAGREYLYVPEFGLRHMEFNQTNDRIELEFISHNLAPDAVFLDVGASYGFYGISVASDFPESTVYCFEPVPRAYECLSRNVVRNGLSNLEALRCAVLDRDEYVSITTDSFGGDHIVGDARRTVQKVKGMTLDHFADEEGLEKVEYIKIDVEGAELLVLQGADSIVRRFAPMIQVETTDEFARRFGYVSRDVFQYLCDRGYNYLLMERADQVLGIGRPRRGSGDAEKDLAVATDFIFFPRDRPPVVDYPSAFTKPLRFPYV